MKHMIWRLTLLLTICAGLSGCAVGVYSSNLENAPSTPADARLFKSVGFVVHKGSPVEADVKSWVDALSGFTAMEHVFFSIEGKPTGMIRAFPEYAETHPIVHIQFKKTIRQGAPDVIAAIPAMISTFSFGVLPGYYQYQCTASFTLEMPANKKPASAQWDYPFNRQQYLWLPLLPMADFFFTLAGGDLSSRWKVEEKRRLLVRFLQDAKPLLQEYQEEANDIGTEPNSALKIDGVRLL